MCSHRYYVTAGHSGSNKVSTQARAKNIVSIRELSRNPSSVVGDVARTDLEDLILSKAPEYLADLVAADEDLRTGKTLGAPRRLR